MFNPKNLTIKLLISLSKREKDILDRRFKLSGQSKKETLGAVGKSLGLTRERIRQIEAQAIRNIKRNPKFPELIRPAEKFITRIIRSYGGVMEIEYALEKVLAGLGKKDLKEKSKQIQKAHIFFLASILDDVLTEARTAETNPAWKLKEFSIDFPKQILKEVIRVFKTKEQPLMLKELIEILKKRPYLHRGRTVSREIVQGILEWSSLVDKNPYDEWGLVSWRTIWPKRVGDKAYLILKKAGRPLHFTEVAKLINQRFSDKRPAHVPAVHNELIINNSFVLIGRGLYALREWGYRSGTVAEIAAWVLEEKGPMVRQELVKEVLRQRMVRSTTVNLALTDKNKFKKLSNGRFALKSH